MLTKVVDVMRTAPGQNIPSANGTAWGLLNGITRYVDFEARSHSIDNRVESAWFGNGATMKDKAVGLVQGLLDHGQLGTLTGEDMFSGLLSKPLKAA